MKHVLLASLAILALPAGAGAQAAAAKATAQPAAAPTQATRLRFQVAPTGNEARYLVVEANGRVIQDSSKIVVQVSTLKTDQTRRDNYLRRRTLETEKFPTVELVPMTFAGITSPIAPGTSRSFSLTGNLTIHGVTRPTTWQVTARADGSDVVGKATTAFTFKDFSLEQPRVPIVMSVADTVRLEYDFRFTPEKR
jgi:polyisoprenoid-binding protein YceI